MKELDFLPASFHQALLRRRQFRQNALLSAGVVIALAGFHVTNVSRLRSAEACLDTLQCGTSSFQNARQLIASLEQRKTLLGERAALLDYLEDNAPLDAIVAETTRYLDDTMAIRSLEVETRAMTEPDTTGQNPKPKKKDEAATSAVKYMPGRGTTEVRLTGLASTDMGIGVFFGRLSSSPLFSNIRMGFSREIDIEGRQMREFQLSFDVRRVEVKP